MNGPRLMCGLAVAFSAATSGCDVVGLGNAGPEVSIVNPTDGQTFVLGDLVQVEVSAHDPDGTVQGTRLFVNGGLVGQDDEEPYTYAWDTSGEQRLLTTVTVEAWDDSGARASDSVIVELVWVYRSPDEVEDGWPAASLQEVGMQPARLEDLVNRIRREADHRIHGIVIVRHGKIVFETYFDGLSHPTWGEEPVSFDRETAHVLSSVAKSYTTTLLGIAIEQGFIAGADARVMAFFPELADLDQGLRSELTLEHLATMSAGLAWDEATYPLDDERNDLTAWLRQGLAGNPNLVRLILAREMIHQPGAVFNYSGGCTNVLGEVIHRATGQSIDDFSRQYLFEPLGITASWWWEIQPGFTYVSGDVAQRPRDMLKLGQMFLNGGVWNGERILSEAWVALSGTPYHRFSQGYLAGSGYSGYSFGWWPLVDEYGPGAYTASGWGGQWITILPAHDMVVALTGGGYWEPSLYSPHEIMTQFILPSLEDGVM